MSNSTGGYCFLVCPYEYKPDYTTYQCLTELVNISKTVTRTLAAASPATSTSFTIANAISGGFSLNMMMCLVATESLANMQYLNINHSNIASTIYSAMSTSYIPNWIASFNDIDRELAIFPWGIFQTNQISSLFLDNFGDALTESMVHLALFILMAGITYSTHIGKMGESFSGRIYTTVFSYFAAGLFGKLQSQLLYAIMNILRMDLLSDSYSQMSLLISYFTPSFVIGLLIFCFFRLLTIYESKNKPKTIRRLRIVPRENTLFDESGLTAKIKIKWLEKKYEFMYEDFKDTKKHPFFFSYWLAGFNATYILLIFSLQSFPVLQCLSITVLALVFIIFPAIIQPFQKKVPAFLHFFNFSCILIAAFLNLVLAITQNLHPGFSGAETQGKVVISVISINTGTNTVVSLSVLLFEIYQKCKEAYNKSSFKNQKPKEIKIEIASSTNEVSNMPAQSQNLPPSASEFHHEGELSNSL